MMYRIKNGVRLRDVHGFWRLVYAKYKSAAAFGRSGGVSEQILRDLHNETHTFRLSSARKIAAALDVPPGEIFKGLGE